MVARPCSHVEPWENGVVAKVGSVGSDCLGGVSHAPYGTGGLPGELSHGQGGDLDSNSALQAVWLQQAQKLCQCKAVSRCYSCIHV